MKKKKLPEIDLVYICDWLPPDFGAVGQYCLGFARDSAKDGQKIVLIGLSSKISDEITEEMPSGSLTKVYLKRKLYNKGSFLHRLIWTFITNTELLIKAWPYMRKAKEIKFTGSPPLFLHWIAPANLILQKPVTYHIMDFHPECLMASRDKPSFLLNLIYKLTLFWRKRVSRFEVLGYDQLERLTAIGIPKENITLNPVASPVVINDDTQPLETPSISKGQFLVLYSGNWGVAHDHETFIEGYTLHHKQGSGRIVLWLNAVGARADQIEQVLIQKGLPCVRGYPVKLADLPSLLITPDAQLITLSDAFVGYVLPSKVYGCISSKKPIVFIGSSKSDVHRLCQEQMSVPYFRVDVGNVEGLASTFENLVAHLEEKQESKKLQEDIHNLQCGKSAKS